MTPIQLALIGPPQVTKPGERVQLPTRKALALLAYLALEPVPHSRESLIAFFWPELDSTRGRAALRRELSRINKVLGEGWVETVGETVQITALVQVDVNQWQTSFAQAQSLALLQSGVTQSVGEFMAGFGLPDAPDFDAWQQRQALVWQQARQQALHTLATRLAQNGEWATAAAAARELVELDPFAEASQRLLMTLLAQAGQRPAALQQYDALDYLLRTELDTEPAPETAALAKQIRSGAVLSATGALPVFRTKSLRRRWLVGGIVLLLVLVVLGWFGWRENRARIQLAQARQLIAQSQAAPEITDRLRLALAANDQLDNFETQAALFDALNQLPPHLVALLPHETAVTALALHEDSHTLATGTADGTIQLWHTKTHNPISEPMRMHDGRITDLLFAADGTLLFSSSLDGQVQLWNVVEQTALGTVQHRTGHVKALVLHPNGRWLFSGGSDGQIMVWDVGQSSQNPPLLLPPTAAHDGAVSSLLLFDDGETLISAGWDSTVRTWQFSPARGLSLVASSQHHTDFVNRLVAVPGEERPFTGYASTGRDGTIVWQSDGGQDTGQTLPLRHTDWAEALVFYNGFYSGGRDGQILWHNLAAQAGPRSAQLAQRETTIWDLAVAAQTGLLYAAEDDGQVTVWHTLPADHGATWIRPYAQQLSVGGNVATLAFLDDEQLIVSLEDGLQAEIVNWHTQAQLICCQQLAAQAPAEIGMAAANGRFVVTASGTELQLVAEEQTVVHRLPLQVTAVQLNAESNLLAVGLADGSVQLLTVDGLAFDTARQPWPGHTEPVLSLAFSPDGRFLASGSWDGTLRLWELASGQSIQLDEHARGVAALAFAADGRILASGSWDDTVIIWDLSPEAWRTAARQFSPAVNR